jgi:hypothetical protein
MPEDSGGTISRDDVNRLADLFGRYDGALDPLSEDSQDAEFQFNALVENLHAEKVLPTNPQIALQSFVVTQGGFAGLLFLNEARVILVSILKLAFPPRWTKATRNL